jgi:uncharacterized protein YkwD
MNDEWLQLTDEDIARAQQLAQNQPPMPDVLTITAEDLPTDEPVVVRSGDIIKVTEADLQPVQAQSTTSDELYRLEQTMYELVNEARMTSLPRWLGTSKLAWNEELAAVARGHSADMLQRQYIAHVSPEGITAARRIDLKNIRYVACGENIGVFYGDAAGTAQAINDIHSAFMNQPRSLTNHRGNLLNPIWTHVGIGIAHNPDGALVATQNFISSPGKRLRGR